MEELIEIASGKFDAIEIYWHTEENPIIQKSAIIDYANKDIKIYVSITK